MSSENALLQAIEIGIFRLPQVPGRLGRLPLAGVESRVIPFSHPLANIVGAARLDNGNTLQTVQQVLHFFCSQGRSFSWRIGPPTTPGHLGAYLVANGLEQRGELTGMVLADLSLPIPTNPAITIREATGDDLCVTSRLMAAAYPLPPELAAILAQAFLTGVNHSEAHSRVYLAYARDSEEPVGIATAIFFRRMPLVSLVGAGTLESHRGKGVYRTLLAHRLAQARAEGIQGAVIQALPNSSAPICRKVGFIERCTIEAYTWSANGVP